MVSLIILTILLVPYILLSPLNRDGFLKGRLGSARRGRISLAILFCFTGVAHFIKTDDMIQMLPAWVPDRNGVIYATGIFELLGAAALLVDRLSRLAGISLILFLVCIFPSNIYAMIHRVDVGGHGAGLVYLWIRLPLQLLLIAWAYYFAVRQNQL